MTRSQPVRVPGAKATRKAPSRPTSTECSVSLANFLPRASTKSFSSGGVPSGNFTWPSTHSAARRSLSTGACGAAADFSCVAFCTCARSELLSACGASTAAASAACAAGAASLASGACCSSPGAGDLRVKNHKPVKPRTSNASRPVNTNSGRRDIGILPPKSVSPEPTSRVAEAPRRGCSVRPREPPSRGPASRRGWRARSRTCPAPRGRPRASAPSCWSSARSRRAGCRVRPGSACAASAAENRQRTSG